MLDEDVTCLCRLGAIPRCPPLVSWMAILALMFLGMLGIWFGSKREASPCPLQECCAPGQASNIWLQHVLMHCRTPNISRTNQHVPWLGPKSIACPMNLHHKPWEQQPGWGEERWQWWGHKIWYRKSRGRSPGLLRPRPVISTRVAKLLPPPSRHRCQQRAPSPPALASPALCPKILSHCRVSGKATNLCSAVPDGSQDGTPSLHSLFHNASLSRQCLAGHKSCRNTWSCVCDVLSSTSSTQVSSPAEGLFQQYRHGIYFTYGLVSGVPKIKIPGPGFQLITDTTNNLQMKTL